MKTQTRIFRRSRRALERKFPSTTKRIRGWVDLRKRAAADRHAKTLFGDEVGRVFLGSIIRSCNLQLRQIRTELRSLRR